MIVKSSPDFDYYNRLKNDMISEFRPIDEVVDEDGNITTAAANETTGMLLKDVLAPQLDSLFDVFKRLVLDEKLTEDDPLNGEERELGEDEYGAIGKQLDGIGDLVCLNRKEAAIVSGLATTKFTNNSGDGPLYWSWYSLYDGETEAGSFLNRHKLNKILPMKVLNDVDYRKYLWFKIFWNNSYCTYYDMMKLVSLLWDVPGINYNEFVETGLSDRYFHATISLETDEIEKDFRDTGDSYEYDWLFEKTNQIYLIAPAVKAAGVSFIPKAVTKYNTMDDTMYSGGYFWDTVSEIELPCLYTPS